MRSSRRKVVGSLARNVHFSTPQRLLNTTTAPAGRRMLSETRRTDHERQTALENLLRRGVEAAHQLKWKDLTRARLGIAMGLGDTGLRDELTKHKLTKAGFVELIRR